MKLQLPIFLLLFVPAIAAAQPVTTEPTPWTPPETLGSVRRLTDPELGAHRPRFSPDGQTIVFHGGEADGYDVYSVGVDGAGLLRLTNDDGDDRDPTYSQAGGRLFFSSNRSGNYDLYSIALDGTGLTRLTELPGDEVEPAANPVRFDFYAIGDDGCTGAFGTWVDGYEKVAFTRREGGAERIWFIGANDGIPNEHLAGLSPEGQRCWEPAWSGNGLSLSFVCSEGEEQNRIFFSEARWPHSFSQALHALELDWEGGVESCGEIHEENWATDPCAQSLSREYARFSPEARTEPSPGISSVSYSANQTVLVVSDSGMGLSFYPRHGGSPLIMALEGTQPESVVWSPDGSRIAFESALEGGSAIYVADTNFYLQDVVDLVDYPELYRAGSSQRLHDNRFVARPGEQREFHVLYDRSRYERRSPFVTADAALQAFHDEFTRLLRQSEERASESLLNLSAALFAHFAAQSDDEIGRYLTVYFGVAASLLHGGSRVNLGIAPPPSHECNWMADELDALPEGEVQWYEENCVATDGGPVDEQIRAAAAELLADADDDIRTDIMALVDVVLAHQGVASMEIPTVGDEPIDFSQFQVRGHYASTNLMGYFLAMMWYGLVPLPLDESSFELLDVLERTPEDGSDALITQWRSIDSLVGSMMGRPVDVSVAHLQQVRTDQPRLLAPFQRDEVVALLRDLRGPIPFRGVSGALEGGGYPLRFSFFPRRYGRDVEFFTAVTHPDVGMRGIPSAIDVMAGLGNDRATTHALEAERGQTYWVTYRDALARLAGETAALDATYWSTDIYHSWLATLVALAAPIGVAAESTLDFTVTEAWADRELFTMLAGFTQLKYTAVLYSFQESGVECGGDIAYYAFTEKPVLQPPRAFVDPQPQFFRSLAGLADRVYRDLNEGDAPTATLYYGGGRQEITARDFAQRLAELSEKQIAGETLTEDENEWLLGVGAFLEVILLGREPYDPHTQFGGDEGRMERGVAIVTDVYTNLQREEVVQLGLGRLMDLYVVVPNTVGGRLTQGGVFSFYEFTHPMSDRLTDETWNTLLESPDAPELPGWTDSFVEPVPSE